MSEPLSILHEDNVRTIIGSFHPVRPILKNQEIYEKILEINPEFCIKSLLKRYERWSNLRTPTNELYNVLMQYRFSATNSHPDDMEETYIQLVSREHLDELALLFDVPKHEGTISIQVYKDNPLYEQLLDALKQYINNEACNPSVKKPLFFSGDYKQYSHVLEEPSLGIVDNVDDYVNQIQTYDPQFSLGKYYYDISKQYKIAKTLDPKFIPSITKILPDLEQISYGDREGYVIFYGSSKLLLDIRGDEKVFEAIVANLYHGINAADIEYYQRGGLIEVDTYPIDLGY